MRAGDAGVWEGEPIELPNDRLVSRALDNRLGAYVRSRSRVASPRRATLRSTSSQSRRCRRRSASTVRAPRRSHSTRRSRSRSTSPGRQMSRAATRSASARSSSAAGAAIARGPDGQHDRLRPARRGCRGGGDRALRSRSTPRRTQTDADAVHVSRGGVPTGLVSVPLRYMHSPCRALLARRPRGGDRGSSTAFARRLTRETSFLR